MQIEPGTSPKHRYELIKATLLVIIGALITITVVYGIDYFSPKAEPDPIAVVEPVAKTDPVVDDVDTINQETTTEKVYSQEELNQIFEMDKKSPDTKLFYSERLGVGFTYVVDQGDIDIREIKNKIYLVYLDNTNDGSSNDPKDWVSQSLEVFTKDIKETLNQSVAKEFLAGADPKNCFIIEQKDSKVKFNPFITTEIGFPLPKDEEIGNEPGFGVGSKCPPKAQDYAQTNAIQFFFTDRQESSQYGFLRIGQDSGAKSGYINNSDKPFWENTIRFLK
jgi:hypothetical protein